MERLVRVSVAATCIGIAAPAAAHPAPFSFVDVRIQPASLDITVVAHIFDLGHDLGVEPPQQLLEPAVLSSRADAIATLVRTRLHLAADAPARLRAPPRAGGRGRPAAPPGRPRLSGAAAAQPLAGGIWSAPQAL